MTTGQALLIIKVRTKGQDHTLDIFVKPCKQDKDGTVWVRTVKLCTQTSFDKRTTPIDFEVQGLKVNNVKCLTLNLDLTRFLETLHKILQIFLHQKCQTTTNLLSLPFD